MKIYDNELGNMEVKTLTLPDYVKSPTGTYSPSGKVLVSYKRDDEHNIYIATVNDDGSDFKDIYEGIIKPHPSANGIRYMVYEDNKRVLLGDYVLECFPCIDYCEKAELIPIQYPWGITEDERVFCHWSEIIIAPDNRHICWTMLTNVHGLGAVNMLGVLKREKDRYVIEDTQIISSVGSFLQKSDTDEGILIPRIRRGGEVKQFIRGGTAISLVGSGKDSVLADTVVQDLMTEDITQITLCPGYEETTIFSPDEKLGIVMSTRASEKTNCAVIGLLPRPFGSIVGGNLIAVVYQYAVSDVRKFRKGNIGPVLVEINKSIDDKRYKGVPLYEPDQSWVYLSPMSWHPSSKKAIWPEMLRGKPDQSRLRIVHLLDYDANESIPVQETPEHIPYGIKDESKLWLLDVNDISGEIKGKYSGLVRLKRENINSTDKNINTIRFIEAEYKNYSDDGKSFYNGYEKSIISSKGEHSLEADLILSGENQGRMKLRITFLYSGEDVKLDFSKAQDGKPASYGYAEYGGIRLNVENMKE